MVAVRGFGFPFSVGSNGRVRSSGGDELIRGKSSWLNSPFFSLRCLLYYLCGSTPNVR